MHEVFVEHKFRGESLRRIQQANEIISEYISGGYSLTLRQLYYQYVQRGIIPNTQQEYKRLGDLLSKARLAGMIDWNVLEDRTRNLKGWSGGYDSPGDYFEGIASGYFVDAHIGQSNYVEVWIEKDALAGVVERPANRWRVRYFSCRGYSSQSEQYAAGQRFANEADNGKSCHILHLGDHDPSGIDMTRDNQDRLSMFSYNNIQVHRIALNMDQVEELQPPPNPAKITDARATEYIRRFGKKSWELDALPPDYIDKLIDGHLRNLIDIDAFNERKAIEREGQREIQKIAERYEDVREYINGFDEE